jgi:hypothetical protein
MGFLFVLLMFGFYMMPTLFAGLAKKRNVAGIAVLNLLLGWTMVAWVGAMVWAVVEKEVCYE